MTDTIEQIWQGELYPLLSLCTKEDLAPLVEVILSKLTNFLDINDDYKAHKPDHTKYYKLIGDEIRLFGGNSIRNLFRSNEGPPYAEIVVDVCKKLDVPYVKNDTIRNEANLLDIFVEQRWQSLDPVERQRLAAEARKAASDQISRTAAIGKAAAGFVIGRLAFGPAGWVALGISLLDANFQVTIPCVLHIAYLRRRFMEEWQEHNQASRPGPKAPVSVARSNALVIAAEDGEPVLSLARIPEPSIQRAWHRLGASDDGISVCPGRNRVLRVS